MSRAIQLPLNNTVQTVTRPVIYDILSQVRRRMRLPESVEIRYYGEDGAAPQLDSLLVKDPKQTNKWAHTENLYIEITESDPPEYIGQIAVIAPDNQRIFADYSLGVYLRPVYAMTRVEVKIAYQAPDQNRAEKWRNEMRTRAGQGAWTYLHTASYSYCIPDPFAELLGVIHKRREAVAGYGDNFTEYLMKCITNRARIVTNLTGEKQVLAIAEEEVQIQGYFTNSGAPDRAVKDEESGRWNSEVTYIFEYEKPIEMVMNYPIMIHNQLLPAIYRPRLLENSFTQAFKRMGQNAAAFQAYTAQNQILQYYGNRGVQIPEFDNFIATPLQAGTVRAFMALAAISPTDLRSLLNLNQLGMFNVHTDVLKFMVESEWRFMAVEFQSILQLTYYKNVNIQSQDSLVVDSALNVSLVEDGDLRCSYRIRLGMMADFNLLNPVALTRLKAYPAAALRIINAINAAIRCMGGNKEFGFSRLPEEWLSKVGLTYDPGGVVTPGEGGYRNPNAPAFTPMGLVESLFVVAQPKSNV
jgi:hypothetical protein